MRIAVELDGERGCDLLKALHSIAPNRLSYSCLEWSPCYPNRRIVFYVDAGGYRGWDDSRYADGGDIQKYLLLEEICG